MKSCPCPLVQHQQCDLFRVPYQLGKYVLPTTVFYNVLGLVVLVCYAPEIVSPFVCIFLIDERHKMRINVSLSLCVEFSIHLSTPDFYDSQLTTIYIIHHNDTSQSIMALCVLPYTNTRRYVCVCVFCVLCVCVSCSMTPCSICATVMPSLTDIRADVAHRIRSTATNSPETNSTTTTTTHWQRRSARKMRPSEHDRYGSTCR